MQVAPLPLGLPGMGDVLHHPDDAALPARLVPHRLHFAVNRAQGAVATTDAILSQRALEARARIGVALVEGLAVLGNDQRGDGSGARGTVVPAQAEDSVGLVRPPYAAGT